MAFNLIGSVAINNARYFADILRHEKIKNQDNDMFLHSQDYCFDLDQVPILLKSKGFMRFRKLDSVMVGDHCVWFAEVLDLLPLNGGKPVCYVNQQYQVVEDGLEEVNFHRIDTFKRIAKHSILNHVKKTRDIEALKKYREELAAFRISINDADLLRIK